MLVAILGVTNYRGGLDVNSEELDPVRLRFPEHDLSDIAADRGETGWLRLQRGATTYWPHPPRRHAS